MNVRSRQFFCLIIAQVICVGVGLWMQQRHLIEAVHETLQQQAQSTQSVTQEGVMASEPMRSLGTTTIVTLFWTVAVLTIAGAVILGWIQDRADRSRGQSMPDVLHQARSLVRTRDAVIFGLAKLSESRDGDTGEHLERICAYATALASELARHSKYAAQITPEFVRLIGISSALHDIGKVGVADRILLKPGKLTEEERTEMQKHAVLGGQCLREIEQRLGSSNFLQMAREIAYAHHERWDGTGYPYGLAGEKIPLSARIVAIADVYDALSSKRVYKPAMPHEKCIAIIREEAGKHFDAAMVETWLSIESRIREIAGQSARTPAFPSDAEGPGQVTTGAKPTGGAKPAEREVEAALASSPGKPRAAPEPVTHWSGT